MRSYFSAVVKSVLVFAPFLFLSLSSSAQTAAVRAPRITQAVDENNLVTLKGNTHPLAKAQYDQGPAPDDLPMQRMLLVLQRSPDQETALRTLVDQQQSKSSPNFHQWLTPAQLGQQFGPADADIQTVTTWLQSHGFQVARVSASGTVVEFSGTAGQVRQGLHTEIHKYVVNGEEHWANATDPQIPAALAPVVAGVNSLNDFRRKPQVKKLGLFQREKDTGKVSPLYSFAGCGTNLPCNALAPADFAKIYNVLPLWNAGIDGTNQTIALVGDSEICTGSVLPAGCTSDDIQTFRTLFGLPANNTTIVLDGPDPGLNEDETEGDLDVEWSGAVAKGANILFVIAEGTEASAGVDLAAEHIIDNNLAPVMSESFSTCEGSLGNAGNLFYKTLWEQAAAQGITVIVSTGDNGSAGCDDENSEEAAQYGTFVNGIASTPFNVAVGGTDFDFTATNYQSTFWAAPPTSSTNDTNCTPLGLSAKCGISALGYVPETTWNDSCANNGPGLNGCNNFTTTSSSINIVAGSGGQSNCVTISTSGSNAGDCLTGYPKPSFQSGAGVPADSVRDVPDLSLFASDGFNSGSFYVVCEADQDPSLGTCNLSSPFVTFIGVGGTSSSAPAFAGIMAMVNQNMVAHSMSGRQGNANYVLYPLAAAESSLANCSSSSGSGTNGIPASGCIFNDVVLGNNSVPCVGGSYACSNTNPNSAALGILEATNPNGSLTGLPGFAAGAGYDLATGLGSVNTSNLVTAWPATAGAFTSTATTLSVSPTATCPGGTPGGTICAVLTHGQSLNITVGVTAGGTSVGAGSTTKAEDVALIGTCVPSTMNCFNGSNTAGVSDFIFPTTVNTPTNANFIPLSGGPTTTVATNYLVGGTYDLTAHYEGDGVNGSSSSTAAIQVTVSPEPSTTRLSVLEYNAVTGAISTLTSGASAPYGSGLLIRADVIGNNSGQESESADGIVDITGIPGGGNFALNAEGYAEIQSPNTSFPGVNAPVTLIPAILASTYSLQASYAGDSSYSSSGPTAPFALTIAKATTYGSVTSGPSTFTPEVSFSLTALIDTSASPTNVPGSLGVAPTGTVSFLVGGVSIGSANLTATYDSNGFAAGMATLSNATIAALYKPIGDAPIPFQLAPGRAPLAVTLALGILLVIALSLRKRRALAFATLLFFVAGLGLVSCSTGGGTGVTPPPGSTTSTLTMNYSGDTNYAASTMSYTITIQ